MGLTGLAALLLMRSALSRGTWEGRGKARRLVAGFLAAAAAAVPVFLGLAGGRSAPSLLLGMGLFTGPPEAPIASTGLVALSSAALVLAALLAATAFRADRSTLALGVAGLSLAVWSFFAVPTGVSTGLLVLGSLLLAVSLSARLSAFRTSDLLSRAVAVALLVGAGAVVTGAGASLGRIVATDARLERTASRSNLDRERLEEEGPAAWEERIAAHELQPWTPGGNGTQMSDLARALWVRGRTAASPSRAISSPSATTTAGSSRPSGRCGPETRGEGRRSA